LITGDRRRFIKSLYSVYFSTGLTSTELIVNRDSEEMRLNRADVRVGEESKLGMEIRLVLSVNLFNLYINIR